MLVKKELASIPVLPFPKVEKKSSCGYVATAEKVNLPRSGEVLVVDFFEKKGKRLLIRFFSDGKNYTTCFEWPAQAWTERNPRTELCGYRADDEQGKAEMVREFLAVRNGSFHASGILGAVDSYISDKAWNTRERRDKKALDLRNAHFAMYPPLPDNIQDYCEEHVFAHGYLFFSAKDKQGRREGECSRCGGRFEVGAEARSGHTTTCPVCGKSVVYRARWNKGQVKDKARICIAEKVEGQLLMRWANVVRTFAWPEFTRNYEFEDYAYNLHLHTEQGPKTYFYKYMPIPYGYCRDWYRGKNGDYCFDASFVYTDNLDQVFGSRYYNVDLKAGLEGKDSEIAFAVLLNSLKNCPAAEYLFKLGLPALAAHAQHMDIPNGEQKVGFSAVMGIGKQFLPLYRAMNVTPFEHRIIKNYGKWITAEELAGFRSLGDVTGYMGTTNRLLQQMSFGKFVRYFQKQREANPKRKIGYLLTQYRDYLDMSKGLKVDLTHKAVRFPADCVEAHARVLARYNAHKKEIENAEFQAAIDSLYAKLPFVEYEKNGFCIVLPQLRSDLITEGQSLNHCVGGEGYYKRHIAGTQMIFFVRKVEDKGKPFFTMELNMQTHKILQLYGFADCSAPKEVRQFAEGFAHKLAVATAAAERRAS